MTRFSEFETAVRLAENDWRTIVGNPYVIAYTQAYTSYKETLDKQKEADKEAGELFVTAACVATGSILLGSIGSVTLKMIAKRTVATIARSTLNDTMFRLFRSVRKNDGVAFAVGAFIDGLKDKAKKAADKVVEDYLQATASAIAIDPLVQYINLDTFMRANVNCAIRMALIVEEDGTMSEADKNEAYRKLRAAPLLNKPVKASMPFKASLSEVIELTFYLSAILETDILESIPAGAVNEYGGTRGVTSKPIPQRPLAKDYPNPVLPKTGMTGYTSAYQNVAINRAGGDVQKRTNELSKKIGGINIYSTGFFGPPDNEKKKEMKAADSLLAKIAVKMKPMDAVQAIG